MKNERISCDNTVVWRDTTVKDFEEALKTLCKIKHPCRLRGKQRKKNG